MMQDRPALMGFVVAALVTGCTPLPWTEPVPQPSASQASSTVAPPSVAPVASGPATPVDGPAGPVVKSCADATLAPVGGGKVTACNDGKGVVLVVEWHLEGDGKGRRAIGTIDRWQDGARSLHADVATSDLAVISAIETAESATLEVGREAGAIRVGVEVAVGEDYRTVTEIVSLFREAETEPLWSGLGTIRESQMDACMKARVATFAFPDEKTVARTTTPTAEFAAQNLDAKLLATLKKECVAGKPRTEKFAL